MSMSKCAWCENPRSKGQPDSHGICVHCLAKTSPNSPNAKRYQKAVARAREKMMSEGLLSPAYLAEINKWEKEL
jgi:hypothetical protein